MSTDTTSEAESPDTPTQQTPTPVEAATFDWGWFTLRASGPATRTKPLREGPAGASLSADITMEIERSSDWEGRRIHILGGTPPTQWEAIRDLTNSGERGPDLSSFGVDRQEPWADIVGLDWNGLFKMALYGKYWHHESPHWRRADELTVRATVRKGLEHVRHYWQDRGVWPTERLEPNYAVRSSPPAPPEGICHGCGHDLARTGSIADRGEVLVEEYEDGTILQFCSERCRRRTEYRDGPIPLSHGDRRGDRLGSHYRERRRAEWFESQ